MSDAWAIQVSAGPVEVRRSERGGSYCVFTFVFRIGAINHRLVERYRIIRDFHSRLSRTKKNVPPFPPKSWLFQSTIDVKFQEKRKSALLEYFKTLVKEPCILKLDIFHTLLNIPENLRRKMVKIAEDLESKKYIIEQHMGGGYSSPTSDYRESPHRDYKEKRGKPGYAGVRQLTGGNPIAPTHFTNTQQVVAQRQRQEALRCQKRKRLNNYLKEIHNGFIKSFPEKVHGDDELDTEVEELKHHSKVKRYEEAIKDYRIFTVKEVFPEVPVISATQRS